MRKINGWDALALAQFLGASGSFERNILQQARKTVFHNTQRSGTRYARIPGPYACPFCLMLASRGAVYLTEKSATSKTNGGRFHDGCHCVAIECLTQDDVPSFIHELEQEWNNTAGHVTTGEKDQQRAWTHYLHSSRPYQVRAGHTMKNVMTVRPTPSVLQAPGQTHLYKKGVKSPSRTHDKANSVADLRKAGIVGGKPKWEGNEGEIASALSTRNAADVEYCKSVKYMTKEERERLKQLSGKLSTPDYVIGDVSVDLKTLTEQPKDTASAILRKAEKASRQAPNAIIDARIVEADRNELAEELSKRMQAGKIPQELLIIGRDTAGEYEIVWP